MLFDLQASAKTDVGLVRKNNEDSYLFSAKEGIFVLADGMGGHNAGEVAAKDASESLFSSLLEKQSSLANLSEEEVLQSIRQFFLKANAKVYRKAQENPKLKGMGTTLASLCFLEDRIYLAHVGDSRIYRLREGQLELLTNDHTLIAELLETELIYPDETADFMYSHVLTRAVGVRPKVRAQVQQTDYEEGDLYLLCSDGLTDLVKEAQIASLLNSQHSQETLLSLLVDKAKELGGNDNITLVIVKVEKKYEAACLS